MLYFLLSNHGHHSTKVYIMANFNKVIIDHLNLGVIDIKQSVAFYEPVLAVLGIKKYFDVPKDKTESKQRIVGFGQENDRPIFWLVDNQQVGTQTHLAFQAESREMVDAFYQLALEKGAKDNGAPGVRFYHKNYYGAFVIDLNGFSLEAVYHEPV